MARGTATKKAAAPEPEVDLTALLDKDPSVVNRAEAAWLVECTQLDLEQDPMDLVERVVQLVAGKAHREWQGSEAAAEIHAEAAERRAAAEAARPARKTKDEEEDGEVVEKPRRGRPRKAAVAVEEDDEEEAVKPAPRRGRPRKAAAEVVEEDEEEAPAKLAPRRGRPVRAKAGSEAPF